MADRKPAVGDALWICAFYNSGIGLEWRRARVTWFGGEIGGVSPEVFAWRAFTGHRGLIALQDQEIWRWACQRCAGAGWASEPALEGAQGFQPGQLAVVGYERIRCPACQGTGLPPGAPPLTVPPLKF